MDFLPPGLDFLPLDLDFLPTGLDFLPPSLEFLPSGLAPLPCGLAERLTSDRLWSRQEEAGLGVTGLDVVANRWQRASDLPMNTSPVMNSARQRKRS